MNYDNPYQESRLYKPGKRVRYNWENTTQNQVSGIVYQDTMFHVTKPVVEYFTPVGTAEIYEQASKYTTDSKQSRYMRRKR